MKRSVVCDSVVIVFFLHLDSGFYEHNREVNVDKVT